MTMIVQLNEKSEVLKAVVRGEFIVINTHFREPEQAQINNVIKRLKIPEK